MAVEARLVVDLVQVRIKGCDGVVEDPGRELYGSLPGSRLGFPLACAKSSQDVRSERYQTTCVTDFRYRLLFKYCQF